MKMKEREWCRPAKKKKSATRFAFFMRPLMVCVSFFTFSFHLLRLFEVLNQYLLLFQEEPFADVNWLILIFLGQFVGPTKKNQHSIRKRYQQHNDIHVVSSRFNKWELEIASELVIFKTCFQMVNVNRPHCTLWTSRTFFLIVPFPSSALCRVYNVHWKGRHCTVRLLLAHMVRLHRTPRAHKPTSTWRNSVLLSPYIDPCACN